MGDALVGITAGTSTPDDVIDRVEAQVRFCADASASAANGPLAVRNIKRAVRACLELPLDKAFDEELRWAAEVLASDDAREGARAFAEKREPNYQGR